MMDVSPLVRMLVLAFEFITGQVVIRKTFYFCTVACCKWVSTRLVESLFDQHALPLSVFLISLDVTLIGFGIDLVLETFEEVFHVPVRSQLAQLYTYLIQNRNGGSGRELPETRRDPEPTQAAPEKIPSPTPKRRGARVTNDKAVPNVVAPLGEAAAAKQRRAPRRNRNQGLEG